MKISKKLLKQIIKEELEKIVEETQLVTDPRLAADRTARLNAMLAQKKNPPPPQKDPKSDMSGNDIIVYVKNELQSVLSKLDALSKK